MKTTKSIKKTLLKMKVGQSFKMCGFPSAYAHGAALSIGATIVTRREGNGYRVWLAVPGVAEKKTAYSIQDGFPMPEAKTGRPLKNEKCRSQECETKQNVIIGNFSPEAEDMHAGAVDHLEWMADAEGCAPMRD